MPDWNRYRQARFLLGVHELRQLPPDAGVEVAIAGRSNAGKSSALNVITGQRALARISKTPGRTQQINFFTLGDQHLLVDLPGYGYAKVPDSVRRHWQRVLAQYLTRRRSLAGLILLMDVRRPLTDLDRCLLDWCRERALPSHILLTKSDKLGRGQAVATLHQTRKAMADEYPGVTAQLFSAQTGVGVDEARRQLDAWFGWPADNEACGGDLAEGSPPR